MADVLKFEKKATPRGAEIPVALREFIDAVIVPALVRKYLADKKKPNIFALANYSVANSAANDPLSREAIR